MNKLFITSAILAMSSVAHADEIIQIDTPCYPTEKVIKSMVDGYGEAPVLIGKSDKETTTIIWINPKNKSYTITTTIPANQQTCVLDSGKSFGEFGGTTKLNYANR